jgi:hypothetical protein
MKTRIYLGLTTFFTAGLVFSILTWLNPVASLQLISEASSQVLIQSQNQLTRATQETLQSVRASLRISDKRSISELAPRVSQVREEVQKNPEHAPPSLLFFATELGKRFQIATLSLGNATGFFDELNSCLEDSRPLATSARALCLREGERLTRYYPALRGNYDLLALKAAPEVRNLASLGRMTERFSR